MMPRSAGDTTLPTLTTLDEPTRRLVRLSAELTAGSETAVREAMAADIGVVPAVWIEELILQSYLFAGFPRALNAMREWRRLSPAVTSPAAEVAAEGADVDQWRRDGEVTCSAVYGSMYEKLRENIRALHPLLDEWMISEGYGKVLSRPELDLPRRELCIVAACAAAGQDRQLQSHLHGARNVGVAAGVIDGAVEAIADVIGLERATSLRLLWARVRRK
ncbi:MAG TPA: carboxymuconolactone decarboxylase family protein [Gemmatimonadaceae bacterium]|jgi:4-carboxymuconolactone decarboxylase